MRLSVDLSESDILDWYETGEDEEQVVDDEGVVFDADYGDVDPFGLCYDAM